MISNVLDMTRRSRWITALAVLALVMVLALVLMKRRASATDHTPASTATAASADGKGQASPPIELTPSDWLAVRQGELSQALELSGSVRAANSAWIKARVPGEIRELLVREGDRVNPGQLLGRIDTTEPNLRQRQAQEQMASAQAQLDIAERTLANNRALVDQGFISRNALDTSVSNAASARSALLSAQAAAELAAKAVRDSEIRAPMAGLVAQRVAQPGERVGVDARLLEIVDLSRLELELAVPPQDVPALRVRQTAVVQLDGLAEPITAQVVRINPSANSSTRTVAAYLNLSAHPGLRQGLFARARIELGRRSALLVPASSVRLEQAQPHVMVIEAGVAVARTVQLGERGLAALDGEPEPAVEVLGGLNAGAEVLRASVGTLRAGTRLSRTTVAAPAPALAPAPTAAPALAASASATAPVVAPAVAASR